jgi:hypothetical protein
LALLAAIEATSFGILYFLAKLLIGAVASPDVHCGAATILTVSPSDLLPGLEFQGCAQGIVGREIPEWFVRELSFFRGVAPDATPSPLALARRSVMSIPSTYQSVNAVFYAALDVLFSSLSVENILHAVSLFLLERPVVVLCSDLHRLSLCTLCLRDLVRPFRSRGTFLAVLPERENYRAVLESPMPYVVGIVKSRAAVRIPEYATVVDLDADTVIDPDDGPRVAGAGRAAARLRALFAAWRVDLPPMWTGRRNPEYAEAVHARKGEFASWHSYVHAPRSLMFSDAQVDEIARIFATLIAPDVTARAVLFFVTDRTVKRCPVTIFNRELFLASLEGPDAPFYRAFAQTMMFNEFIDTQVDEKGREPAPLPILVPEV